MVLLRLPHQSISPMCLLILTLALLYKLPSPVSANYEHTCHSDDFNTQRNGWCGESLANTILSLCRALSDSFVGNYLMKRTPEKGTVKKRLSDISLTKPDAFSYLSKRQTEQNIVCECCVNSCTFTEMYQYCELPPITFKRRIRGEDDKLQKGNRRNYKNLEDSNPLISN